MKSSMITPVVITSAVSSPTNQTAVYQLDGKTFCVESVFRCDHGETLDSILLRLIQADTKETE